VLAPNAEFVYRPTAVLEPFVFPPAPRYPLAPIVRDAGAELLTDELAWIDPDNDIVHTKAGGEVEYDVLALAIGARIVARYTHAITIDDRRMDETLDRLIDRIDAGAVKRLAFISPGRMAWPLPLYELALMTAERAREANIELSTTIVSPEVSPLAIFGSAASEAIMELLEKAHIDIVNSAHAEVPDPATVVVSPGERRLNVDQVIALPELYGPCVRGIPLGEHGFIHVNSYGRVLDVDRIYAAGDATDFPVKHGGLGSQQADAVAQSIAALAGAPVTPQPFHPVIRGMLLTGKEPLYLTARITGKHGFSSEVTRTPSWSPPSKIAAKYLAPYLDQQDKDRSILPTA
jgi:sulfide:quinone oxidoreductase